MNEQYAIQMRGICKSFGQIKANQNINLNLKKGEYPAFPNGKRDICHLRDRGGRFFARGAAEYAFRHKLAVSALFKTLE
jgi:hypothetical protein